MLTGENASSPGNDVMAMLGLKEVVKFCEACFHDL